MYHILLLLILILVIIYNNNNLIEGYDARYDNMDFATCAEFCKTTANCHGFGYDKTKKVCYPSETPIVGRPLDSIFNKEYIYENASCNKIKTIDRPQHNPSFEERRSNSIYVCTENKDTQPQYYFHNQNQFTNIGEGKNIDNIFNVDNYEVRSFKWPRNKFDYDQLDILYKYRENQTFTPENVTDINRIVDYVPKPEIKEEEVLKPVINITPILDFKLENIKNGIYDFMKKMGPTILIPTSKYDVNEIPIKKRDQYVSFKENNHMNTGEYLMDHKCTKNIPLKDCVDYCSKNDQCMGVEWNPAFYDSQNLCCPYKTIGEYTKRTDDKSLGKFYEKTFEFQLNKENNYIS